MRTIEEKIISICKENDLPVLPNIRNNVITIIESAQPSKEEKLEVFDLYDEWVYKTLKNEE